MNPALPSLGEPELSWQTQTELHCYYCVSSPPPVLTLVTATQRDMKSSALGVDKQRMPSHVILAWLMHWLEIEWWLGGTHTHTHWHVSSNGFHLSLTCLGQAFDFRCPVLNTQGKQGDTFRCTHLKFQLNPLQSIKLQDTVRPREKENPVRQEMEQTDRQAGKSLIVILPALQSMLVTAKSLSEGHGRSDCCRLNRGGSAVCFV